MANFIKPSKETLKSIEHLLSEEFIISNAVGDTISGGYISFNVSLSDNTSLVFNELEDAVDKLVERQQQFC